MSERLNYSLLQLEEAEQEQSPVSPDADEAVVSSDATFYLVSEAEGDDYVVMKEDNNFDQKNPIGKSRNAREKVDKFTSRKKKKQR